VAKYVDVACVSLCTCALSWLKLVGDQLFAKEAKVSGQKMLL
jgi:hypothetical protein